MSLRGSELAAIAVIVASVLATGGAIAFGSGTTPKPGPEPTTTEPPPLPTESVPPSSEPPADGEPGAVGEGTPVTITGIGPLTVGLTLEQVEEATGVAFAPQDDAACTIATPEGGLEGVELVVNDGEVAAVSFVGGGYKTRSGIGIGATEQAVLSTYADQIEQAEGSLTFVPRDPGDDQFRIVFRTEAGAVTRFSAGLVPHVVEGCG